MKPEIESIEASVNDLESRIGQTEETKKMRQYLTDILVNEDPKIVSDILLAISIRVTEILLEIGVRDTDPDVKVDE